MLHVVSHVLRAVSSMPNDTPLPAGWEVVTAEEASSLCQFDSYMPMDTPVIMVQIVNHSQRLVNAVPEGTALAVGWEITTEKMVASLCELDSYRRVS